MPRTANASKRIACTKGTAHLRGQLWFALRILRCTNVGELMAVAEQTKKRSALNFLRYLGAAGFVRVVHGNGGKHEPTTYVLIRDTGPKCPSILDNGKSVFDHNTDKEYRLDGR
jgi:hypothetical protein